MITTLDEAIQHCEEIANKQFSEGCSECGNEHLILANWLKRLNRFENYANQIKQLSTLNKNLYIKASELEWLVSNIEISKSEYLERICEINISLLENEATIGNLVFEMIGLVN